MSVNLLLSELIDYLQDALDDHGDREVSISFGSEIIALDDMVEVRPTVDGGVVIDVG